MTTVSVVMGLLALGVALSALVWCRKLSESLTRLIVDTSNAKEKRQLAELANESQLLRTHVDRLRQSWEADTARLDSLAQQLESKIAWSEQARDSLGSVSKDLENLRNFRTQVEQIHARIQKAFNDDLAGTSSAMPRDGGPQAKA
jgi:cell division protein FtsB